MRTQAERDEQTLDIMSAVFGGVVVFALIATVVWIGHVAGLDLDLDADTLVPVLVVVYFAVVAVHLRRRRH